MPASEKYAHGTLAGFLGGCRSCDCCASAFANHLDTVMQKLYIFATNEQQAHAWARDHKFPTAVTEYVRDHDKQLRERCEGYFVVLEGVTMTVDEWFHVKSAQLKEITA